MDKMSKKNKLYGDIFIFVSSDENNEILMSIHSFRLFDKKRLSSLTVLKREKEWRDLLQSGDSIDFQMADGFWVKSIIKKKIIENDIINLVLYNTKGDYVCTINNENTCIQKLGRYTHMYF